MSRPHPLRRWACLAALIATTAALIAGCGGGSSGETSTGSSSEGGGGNTPTLKVATLPIADLGAYFYALDNGLFEKHGVKVQDQTVSGGAAGIAAMTGGSVDLTYTNNVSVLLASAKGLPIQIVSGGNLNKPEGKRDMGTMVATPDIHSAKDLVGKKITSNALENINWLYERVFLRRHGVDPDKADYVEIDFPEQPTALETGQVAASLMPEPFASQSLANGARSLGFPYRIGPGHKTFIGSYVATPKVAVEKAKAIAAFKAALDEAIEKVDGPDAAGLTKAIANHTKLTPKQIESIPLPTYTTAVPRDLLEYMEGLMRKEGMFKDEAPDLDKVIGGQ